MAEFRHLTLPRTQLVVCSLPGVTEDLVSGTPIKADLYTLLTFVEDCSLECRRGENVADDDPDMLLS